MTRKYAWVFCPGTYPLFSSLKRARGHFRTKSWCPGSVPSLTWSAQSICTRGEYLTHDIWCQAIKYSRSLPSLFPPQMEAIVDVLRSARFRGIFVTEQDAGSITGRCSGKEPALLPNILGEGRHERAAEIEPKRGVEHFE